MNIQILKCLLQSFDGTSENWMFFGNLTPLFIITFFYVTLKNLTFALFVEIRCYWNYWIFDDNYNPAWSLLQKLYENKQIFANNHSKTLFKLNIVNKKTHQGPRDSLDGMQKHMKALELLVLPVVHSSSGCTCHCLNFNFIICY